MISLQYLLTHTSWAGALLLLCAVREIMRTHLLNKKGIITQGTVIRLEVSESGNAPFVEYKTKNGESHELRVITTLGKEDWSVGTQWPVRYDPAHVTSAQIDRPVQQWGKAVLFIVLGLGLCLVGVIARYLPISF